MRAAVQQPQTAAANRTVRQTRPQMRTRVGFGATQQVRRMQRNSDRHNEGL